MVRCLLPRGRRVQPSAADKLAATVGMARRTAVKDSLWPLENPLGWARGALRWSPKRSAALTGVAAAALAPPLRRRVSI